MSDIQFQIKRYIRIRVIVTMYNFFSHILAYSEIGIKMIIVSVIFDRVHFHIGLIAGITLFSDNLEFEYPELQIDEILAIIKSDYSKYFSNKLLCKNKENILVYIKYLNDDFGRGIISALKFSDFPVNTWPNFIKDITDNFNESKSILIFI